MAKRPGKKADPLIGAVIDRRWHVIDQLGAGGMGVVYRAERLHLGKQVALKFLHQSVAESKTAVARFEREAKAISRLHHMHCISILDFGVYRRQPYIVMEFVQGRQLTELAPESLTPARAVAIMRQVLLGLHHAHSRGVIHRDLKLSNVMLVEMTGTEDLVKILDFGLARVSGLHEELSADGLLAGTPSYMSPEQALGKKTDLRTDIYSAGVMLYVLATGKRPFVATDTKHLLYLQVHEEPPRPRRISPAKRISEGLERVIMRALEKKPADRFQNVGEFLQALDDTQEGQETLTPTVLRDRPRSRWRLFAFAAAACIALGAAGALWGRSYVLRLGTELFGVHASKPALKEEPKELPWPSPPPVDKPTPATAQKPTPAPAASANATTPPRVDEPAPPAQNGDRPSVTPGATLAASEPKVTPAEKAAPSEPKLTPPEPDVAPGATTPEAEPAPSRSLPSPPPVPVPARTTVHEPTAKDARAHEAAAHEPRAQDPTARDARQSIQALLDEHKVNQAKNQLRDRVAVHPDDAWAHLALGSLYVDEWHYRKDAFREWDRALRLEPALKANAAFRKSLCEAVDASDATHAQAFLKAHFGDDESAGLLAACIHGADQPERIENTARVIEAVAGAERPELGMAAMRMLDVAKTCAQKKSAVETIGRLRYLRARSALVKLDRQRLAQKSHLPPALACFGTSISEAIEQLK